MTIDLATLLSKAIEQGGAVIVAIFAIWVLKGVNELRVEEQKSRADEQCARAEEIRADKDTLVEIVKANTVAISSLTNVIERNTRATEAFEIAQGAHRIGRRTDAGE